MQVRDRIALDIQNGTWEPGVALPSEFELAELFGVSQGTVRKALDLLTLDQLLVRRQGRGTFVAEHTPADMLFRYFQFRDAAGNRVIPDSRTISTKWGAATRREAEKLALVEGVPVIRHARVRTHRGRPFIYEVIVLSEARFPRLGKDGDIPNTLYDKFQRDYGVTVQRAEEAITTRAARKAEARLLEVAPGASLLVIDRRTYALGDIVIEWRLSLCHLAGLHYAVEVG
jgi:GntR family transcriptional regulator